MPNDTTPFGALSPGYTDRLFQIESGGNPYAVTGSNRGLGQFGPDEEARYGITDRTDRDQQVRAVQQEATEHAAVLARALGRPPTPGELYLTHQQGVAGGPALLTASDSTPAWQVIRPYYKSDAIAKQAITGNIPSNHPLSGQDANDITAGDFRNMWVNKFEGRGVQPLGPNAQPFTAQPAGMLDLSGMSAQAQPDQGQPGQVAQGPNFQPAITAAQKLIAPSAQSQPLPPMRLPMTELARMRLLQAFANPVKGQA